MFTLRMKEFYHLCFFFVKYACSEYSNLVMPEAYSSMAETGTFKARNFVSNSPEI
jgi:hypothetical protein